MQIQIAKKKYELYLGFDFIRYLDKQHELDTGLGIAFGVGVGQVMAQLEAGNPLGILSVIEAGTCTLPDEERPTEKDVEKLIEETSKKGELDKLFFDFKELLKTSPMTTQALTGYQSILDTFQQLVTIGMQELKKEQTEN
ncbi:MAG: tail assembly chaperone [Eubacteriales bacterium]|nr:tail assembly chaperone [Eubacteriales bacterium]